MPKINNELCMGCGKCLEICGFDAIDMVGGKAKGNKKCIACWMCAGHCPVGAITVKEIPDHHGAVEKWIHAYAKKHGFAVKEESVGRVAQGLLMNLKKHGAMYCPCRIVTGKKDIDEKSVCPCAYHKREIEEDGECHCMLFTK